VTSHEQKLLLGRGGECSPPPTDGAHAPSLVGCAPSFGGDCTCTPSAIQDGGTSAAASRNPQRRCPEPPRLLHLEPPLHAPIVLATREAAASARAAFRCKFFFAKCSCNIFRCYLIISV
jgi:hypothetical protein